MNDTTTLQEFLQCDDADLKRHLDTMSARQCEQLARELLDELGGPTFEKYLTVIAETMAPPDGSGPPENVDAYFLAVRGLFPHIEHADDRLGRLCALVIQLCRLHLRGKA